MKKIASLKMALLISGGFVLVAGLIWLVLPTYVTTPRKARELVLQQDLSDLRTLIRQYTLDKEGRPHSLNELVVAGYIKEIPKDPMTGRNDIWILKCSNNPSSPGIEGIESGYGTANSGELRRCD
jgi:general secretion pathway protein G